MIDWQSIAAKNAGLRYNIKTNAGSGRMAWTSFVSRYRSMTMVYEL